MSLYFDSNVSTRTQIYDYMALLGVNEKSSDDDIRKAKRAFVWKYHPDRAAWATKEEKAKLTKEFQIRTDAFDSLLDSRASYLQQLRRNAPVRSVYVPCTLQFLFTGGFVQVRTMRQSLSPDRSTEMVFLVHVPPGARDGYIAATAMHEGDEIELGISGHLSFVVEELKHDVFARQGDDLFYSVRLSFAEKFKGFERVVRMPNGAMQRIFHAGYVRDDLNITIGGVGIPKLDNVGSRGDLLVNLTFPVELPEVVGQALSNAGVSGTAATRAVPFVSERNEM